MFTDSFIRKPILAMTLNLLLVVAGLAAAASLQIRQFPKMQFTVVTVTTVYTGASADLVQGFVTQPLQEQIAAADGVDYLTSESRSGTSLKTSPDFVLRPPSTPPSRVAQGSSARGWSISPAGDAESTIWRGAATRISPGNAAPTSPSCSPK